MVSIDIFDKLKTNEMIHKIQHTFQCITSAKCNGKDLCSFHKTYSEPQILKFAADLDKCFSKYHFSKAKLTRFEKMSFELTVTEIRKIEL